MVESNVEPRPNHQILLLDGLTKTYFSMYPEHFSDIQSGSEVISTVIDVGLKTFDMMMNHERMQQFLKKDHKFDLVIIESFATEAFYGFGEHFNAPLIGLSTTVATGWLNMAVGNYDPWSSVPNQFLHAHPEMTFNNRFNNVLLNIYEYFEVTQRLIPEGDRLMKKHFPTNMKSLQQVMKNDVSLGFVNDHFTLSLPRTHSPNLIEIGGIHMSALDTHATLDGEFKAFMDSSKSGVIVFSLGSLLKASELKKRERDAFISVFSKLKQNVVWCYDLPDAHKLPKNILGRPWIPQRELLKHKNVKLFITHGGMLGSTEAVTNGVPLLGLPFFGDQHVNIARAEYRGYALKLSRYNISEGSLTSVLGELLGKPKYADNARTIAAAFKDKPMTAEESVVYWSEYVIRHKGAPFMKPILSRMGVIEFNNMDVWACLFVLGGLTLGLISVLSYVVISALMHFKEKIKND